MQVILSKFDGGHAEDIRTTSTDECEFSKNFDLFTDPHKLIPFTDSIAETVNTSITDMEAAEIDSVDIATQGSSYYVMGAGFENALSTKTTFYSKTVNFIGSFADQGVDVGGTYTKGSFVVYKEKGYALRFNSGQYILLRFDAAGVVTPILSSALNTTDPLIARPFVHPEDNILYIVIGNNIISYDDVNPAVVTSSILPFGMEATSLTDYGIYLAIAMRPKRGNGSSTTYLWGRDTSLNTLQGNVDFGEGNILMLENINNYLIAIMIPNLSMSTPKKFTVKGYSGGAVQILKSFNINSNLINLNSHKVKNDNKLYFAASNDDAVYAFGQNKEGQYILTQDRYIDNSTVIGSLIGLSMIGDVMWRAFFSVTGVFSLMRSKVISFLGESASYTSPAIYRTTINPSMAEEDRKKDKQLDWVRLAWTGANTGLVTVKFSVDGQAFATIISQANTIGEKIKEATAEASGKPFLSGREFQFEISSTGGAQIKEFAYNYTILPTQQ